MTSTDAGLFEQNHFNLEIEKPTVKSHYAAFGGAAPNDGVTNSTDGMTDIATTITANMVNGAHTARHPLT